MDSNGSAHAAWSLAGLTTLLRSLLGFDEMRRQLALSFAAALFAIGFVAPRRL